MCYVLGMRRNAQRTRGDSGDDCIGGYIASYDGSCSDIGSAAYLYIVDYAGARPDVHVIPNLGSGRYICTDGGELADMEVVANHCGTVDDGAAAVLYVEAIAYTCLSRNQQTVAAITANHQLGQRVEPSFMLAKTEPKTETHRRAAPRTKPYLQQ